MPVLQRLHMNMTTLSALGSPTEERCSEHMGLRCAFFSFFYPMHVSALAFFHSLSVYFVAQSFNLPLTDSPSPSKKVHKSLYAPPLPPPPLCTTVVVTFLLRSVVLGTSIYDRKQRQDHAMGTTTTTRKLREHCVWRSIAGPWQTYSDIGRLLHKDLSCL